MTPRLASIPTAAQGLDVSTRTVRRMAERGQIKIVKIGVRALVDLDSVDRFLASLPAANYAPERTLRGA